LQVGEPVERAGERRGKFDGGEGVQRSGEVAAGFGEGFALRDDGVGGFEEGAELGFEGVEVEFAVVEPLVLMSVDGSNV